MVSLLRKLEPPFKLLVCSLPSSSCINNDQRNLRAASLIELSAGLIYLTFRHLHFTHVTNYAGEAVFVDDIPSPTNCLHGAFIHSMKPYARVKDIKFKSKLLPDGVSGLISVRDIPKGGENRGCTTRFGTESLFADELTQYAGERLAFVVITSSSIFI